MSHRNKLPPKASYDESVPAGTPVEQWIWLLNEYFQPSCAFRRIITRMRRELEAVRTKRLALEGQGIPSEETQKELIVELEGIAFERGSLHFRELEAAEAAQELLSEQARIFIELGRFDHRKFTRRERRIEREVLDIEEQSEKFHDEVEAEKAKVKALCPIYKDFKATAFFIASERYLVRLEAKRQGVEPDYKPIAEYGIHRVVRVEGDIDLELDD